MAKALNYERLPGDRSGTHPHSWIEAFFSNSIFALLLLAASHALTGCESGGSYDSSLGSPSVDTPPPPTTAIGNSALQIAPVTYNFGLVAVSGSPVSLTVVAQNITAVPIYISSITGPNDPNFHVLSSNCPASTSALTPSSSCAVVVQFLPVVGGSFQYQISAQFGTTAGDSSLHTAITLTGIGVGQLSFSGLNPIDPNQVTTTSVPLTWNAVAGASSYAIYKTVTGGSLTLEGYASSSATSYTVQGLSPNTSYVFQANAINTLGQPDSNTTTQLATTDTLGSFAAPVRLVTSEGGNATSGDLGLNCTDARGHYPSFMTLTSQSDPAAQCTLLTSPFRVHCQPSFKTGHAAFSSTLTLSCLLDAWPTAYVQTMTVNVADTDRAPTLAPIGNQSVLAGTPIATVTSVASDPDSDSLTYSCQYDNLVDGSVAGGAATCASLLNQDGTVASFSTTTGVFAWTPPLSSSNLPFEVRITANDGFGITSSQVFVLSIGEPPPDPAHSLITVSSGSVTSGSSVTVTLTAKDPNGNPIPQGGSSVVFSNSGGSSTGTFSATTDQGNGTYTATFTGVLSGSATAIHATAQGSLVTTAAPSVGVSPGALSVSKSAVSVSSSSVASGSTVTVTLTSKDAAGNLIPTGGQAVAFSRSGGTSTGSFSGTTDAGNGTYTASFTGLSAGSATTIGGTVGGSALSGTLPTVAVIPGTVSLSQSTLTVTGGATLDASGSSLTLSLVTRDSNGNALTAGGQTVTLAKTGGSSTGSFSTVLDNGNGTYSATFTGAVSGTATSLVASLGGVALTSTAPSVSVVPGPPSLSLSTLSVGAASIVSGSGTPLTLTTRDGNGNALTTGGQTITYTQSSGTSTGTITALSDLGNGTYTATFTGVLAGTATTLGATLNGAALSSTLPNVTVTVGPISLAQSVVTPSSGSVVSGSSVSVSLQTKDAAGNSLTTGGRAVLFTRSGGTSTGSFSGTVDAGNGTYTSNFTGSTAGTSTQVSATVDGSALTSAPASIGVVPAGLSLSQSTVAVSSPTVVSGGTVSLLVTAKDTSGNPLGTGGLTVTFTASGGASTGSIGSVTDNGNGTYGAVFTAAASGAATTIHATIGGGSITSTLPTIAVAPGSLSLSQSIVTLTGASTASGSAVTATLSLKDSSGNSLGTGGQTVVFTRTGGSSTLLASATTDNGNGTYTATLTGQASGTALSIGATVGGVTVTSAAPTLTVIPGALSLSQSTLTLTANTVASGNSVTATLATKDAYGNSLGVGGQTVFFAKSGGTSTVSLGSITDHGDGIYTAPLTGQVSGSLTTITATVGGAGITSTLPTLTVIPGALSLAQSSVSLSSPTVNSGGTVILTLSARDAGGNSLGVGGQTVVFSRTGAGTSTGTIGSVTDNTNGTYTATFTAQASGSASQITATIGGSTITSALPTITVSPGAVSLAQSLLTISAPTLTSGSAVNVTLSTKDNYGNGLTSGGQTVVFSRTGAGTSTGTISSLTDNSNGTYTATFTGTAAGSATTLNASVGGSAITSALPSVTVTPGSASLATSLVTLSSSNIASGSAVTLTLTTKDAAGNPLTSGGATVVFTATGGTSTGSISSTTDNSNGTYSATFTGILSGTSTSIGATIGGTPLSTALPTETVTPGPYSLSQSQITVSSGSVASGNAVTLTLTAKDSAGNLLTLGGRTVVLTKTGGTSTGTISATTDNSNGTYTATFTGAVSGTATTIGATINASAVTSAGPTVAVTPGSYSLSQSLVSLSANTVASGSSVTLTLTTKDASGNLLLVGGQTVVFTKAGGGSTGSISATTDNSNGTYSATLTGAVAGSAISIGATIGGAALTSTLPTLSVIPGPASVAQSLASVSAASVASGTAVTLTLTAKDASGNLLTTGGSTVVLTTTGGTSTGTISATTDTTNGTYTATFTGLMSGSATSIGATIGGTAITTALPTVTVTPGPYSLSQSQVSVSAGSVASGNAVTLTLTTKDAAGNSLTSGGRVVVFTKSGGTSTGTISATTDNSNGTYTATFTGSVSGSATTIGATIGGAAVTSTLPTEMVIPGAASLAQSLVNVSSGSVASGGAVTVTLTAKDAAGNALTAGGLTVTFSRSGGGSSGTISATTDNSNGTYTATFTGTTSGTATTMTATIGGASVTSSLPTVSVSPGPFTLAQSGVSVSASSVASGGAVTLTLTTRDAAGNSVPTGGQTVVFSRSGGSSSGTISATTDNGNGTYTATFTGTTSGTATALSATIGGAAVTSALPTVTVTPGTVSLAQSTVAITGSPTIVASGAVVTLVLTTRDSNGNLITTGGQTVVFTVTGGTSTGNLGAVTDNGNGTYSSTFTGVAAGTANAMSAKIAGVQLTSAAPSLSVVSGSSSLSNSVITVGSASISSGSSTSLTLTVKDGNGNTQSTGGLTVVFSSSGGVSTGSISATTDNNNGTYSASFTGIHAGSATTIAASIGGGAVTSTLPTVTVAPGIVSLSQTLVSVTSASLASGGTSTITLTAKDANSNQLSSGGKTIVFGTTGGTSTGTIGSVTDSNNGTYTATFTATGAGSATTLTATVNAAAVTSTLPTLTVNTGSISPAQSTFVLSSSSLTAGGTATATLVLKDGSGNTIADSSQVSNLTFTVLSTGTSSGTFGPITAVGGSAGSYQATFTASTSGTANTLRAVLAGTGNFSTNPSFSVVSAPASAAQSTAVASSASVTDNGIATSTITVTLKDAYLNLIPAKTVTLSSNRGGSDTISASSGPSSASGVVTFTVKSAVQGTSTYTATDSTDTVTVTQAPTVSYVAGAVSPTLSTVTATPATNVVANNVTTSSILVTLLDSSSNPVSGKTVSLASSRSGSDTVAPATGVTNSSGQATFAVASTAQGTSVLSATDVTDSNLLVTPTASVAFISGAVSQTVSTVIASTPVSSSINQTTVTVTLTDAYSNPVSGKSITLSSSRSGQDTITSATQTTGATGILTFPVSTTTAGSSTFTATDTTDTIVLSTKPAVAFLAGSPFNADWPMNALSSSSVYSYNSSSIDFTGGIAELTSSSQTDNSSTLFNNGSFTGSAFDATNAYLRIGNAGGCNGLTTNCASPRAGSLYQLNSSWTPAWSNLTGYWKLDDALGSTTVFDSSGKANTGTLQGTVTLNSLGQFNTSGAFDGSTGYVTTSTSFNSPQPFTISAWFKTSNAYASGGLLVGFGSNQTGTPGSYDRLALMNNAGNLVFGIYNGGAQTITSPLSYNDGKWHFFAGTYTANSLVLYVDGQSVASTATNVGSAVAYSGYWRIGGGIPLGPWSASTSSAQFGGAIDEVAIWNTNLSSAQLNTIYSFQTTHSGIFTSRVLDGLAAGQNWTTVGWTPTLPFGKALPDNTTTTPVSESPSSYASQSSNLMSGIVGLWHLDESAGTSGASSVIDHSGAGNGGTPTSVTFGNSGKIGTAANFNGTSSYIDAGNGATLGFTTAMTASAWINTSVNVTGTQEIVSKSPGNASLAFEFRINNGGGGNTVQFIVGISGAQKTAQVSLPLTSTWYHVAGVFNGSTVYLYLDGKLVSSAAASGTMQTTTSTVEIGARGGGGTLFTGLIDEVALWNRALSDGTNNGTSNEILELYRRGANRIKYQVRSCSDSACTTGSPNWLGPDGTNQSYFSELYSTASNSLTGAVSAGAPTMTFANFGAPFTTNLTTNRYFQYRAILESDDSNNLCNYGSGATACSPELSSVSVGPTHYDSSIPTVTNITGVGYHYLTSLAETLGATNGCSGGTKYQLSKDGSTWYYWTGAAWALSNNSTNATGYGTATSASALTAAVLNAFSSQVGTGSIYFKAFLKSDGTHACEIDDFAIGGNS